MSDSISVTGRVAELEQALLVVHNHLHKGNVLEAHEVIHRAMGVTGDEVDPLRPRFYRDFEQAFLTAVRRHNVQAAYVIFDQPDPAQPRKVRILTGGDVWSLQLLKPMLAAGGSAVGPSL